MIHRPKHFISLNLISILMASTNIQAQEIIPSASLGNDTITIKEKS